MTVSSPESIKSQEDLAQALERQASGMDTWITQARERVDKEQDADRSDPESVA